MTFIIWAIHLLAILGLAFWMERKEDRPVRSLFWPALGIRLLAGLGLGWIYQHYYLMGDTFNFFDQAATQAQVFKTDPGAYLDFIRYDSDGEWKGAARSAFFIKMVSGVAILSAGNYWITSLWFSFVSFLAALYLVKTVTGFFEGAMPAAAFAFLFFPSVVFWGSGVIKESMGLASLMVVSGVYLKIMMRRMPSVPEFIFAAVSIWVVWNLKYYWISVFLPVICTSLVIQLASTRMTIPSRTKLSLWIVLFLVLCFGVSQLHPNFYPERILQVVVENNRAFTSNSDPGDVIGYWHLQATWSSMIVNSPWALVSGLFRPVLWEADTLLKFAATLENSLLLILCVTAVGRIGEFIRSPNRLITLSMMVYIFLLCIFLAISTPNFGSLARYKVGFLPFLVFLVSYKNPFIKKVLSLPLAGRKPVISNQ